MTYPAETGFGSLRFGSCFAYAPHGEGAAAAAARQLCIAIKSADAVCLARLAPVVVRASRSGGALAGVFGPDLALIPVPGSASGSGRPWSADYIARLLLACGLAACIWPVLGRRLPVPRSARAAPGARPGCRVHRVSFAVAPARPPASRALLVDDVITKGRTLLAAAECLRSVRPQLPLEAFALLRTLPRGECVSSPLQPCRGWIEWTGRDARRIP